MGECLKVIIVRPNFQKYKSTFQSNWKSCGKVIWYFLKMEWKHLLRLLDFYWQNLKDWGEMWINALNLVLTEITQNGRKYTYRTQSWPYNNPLLIRNRSWILTIHKTRILKKAPWKNVFELQKVGKKYTNRGL